VLSFAAKLTVLIRTSHMARNCYGYRQDDGNPDHKQNQASHQAVRGRRSRDTGGQKSARAH
jgi:hypothetical protein